MLIGRLNLRLVPRHSFIAYWGKEVLLCCHGFAVKKVSSMGSAYNEDAGGEQFCL